MTCNMNGCGLREETRAGFWLQRSNWTLLCGVSMLFLFLCGFSLSNPRSKNTLGSIEIVCKCERKRVWSVLPRDGLAIYSTSCPVTTGRGSSRPLWSWKGWCVFKLGTFCAVKTWHKTASLITYFFSKAVTLSRQGWNGKKKSRCN